MPIRRSRRSRPADRPRTRRARPALGALLAALPALVLAAPAPAQVGPPSTPPPVERETTATQEARSENTRFMNIPGLEPGLIPDIGLQGDRREMLIRQFQRYPAHAVGYRAEFNRRYASAYPVVVIVEDLASYLDALRLWLPSDRFPVLIDDGRPETRRAIARFVRAFREGSRAEVSVVRWRTPNPRDIDDPRAETERALSRLFSANVDRMSARESAMLYRRVGKRSPGVVVADPDHPAWVAALPLAVAHNQLILWVDTPRSFDAPAPESRVIDLARQIESALQDTGETWAGRGDAIDTLTLALDVAPMYTGGDGERYATTDRLGRRADDPSARWAWAAQIHGDAPEAAYRAMSALFSNARRAWLFDAYPPGMPWAEYAMADVTRYLGSPRWETILDASPEGSRERFLGRGDTPLPAELIMINTKGLQDRFELNPGEGRVGDLPILDRPAGVYFVHSFSAFNPSNPRTIAGRWFERGAFAYVGAVDEPTLGAFVRPELVAGRLRLPAPWAAATMHDRAEVWKVAVFGDALWTPGPAQLPSRRPFPLENTVDLQSQFESAARDGRLPEAVEILHMLGRDEDAARLVAAAVADEGVGPSPELAAAAIAPLFHAGERALLVDLYRALDPETAESPWARDYLWHAARRLLMSEPDADLLTTLRVHIRPAHLATDAGELVTPYTRVLGVNAAVGMLQDLRARTDDAATQRSLDRLIERARAG